MQASQYVFLRRDLDTDLKRLSRAVDYYADMQRPYQVEIFFWKLKKTTKIFY